MPLLAMTELQLELIRARARDVVGDVWHDGEEIGDQLRRDLAELLDEVDRLRAPRPPGSYCEHCPARGGRCCVCGGGPVV